MYKLLHSFSTRPLGPMTCCDRGEGTSPWFGLLPALTIPESTLMVASRLGSYTSTSFLCSSCPN